MTINVKNKSGMISIDEKAIGSLIGLVVVKTVGVVGMVSTSTVKNFTNSLLNTNDYSKGVVIKKENEENINIDIYIVAKFGIKITEVAKMIQANVKQLLNQKIGVESKEINIIIQDIKE